jgi:GTP-binding protein
MSPAKPVKKRIRKPREEDREGGLRKPADFNVARRSPASGTRSGSALPLVKATYRLSIHDTHELPPPGAPELAFAGRSNAGKSSAINALTGRKRLAFVSKTPGRTQLINFFSLGDAAFLVDLPGYGFADAPHAVREHWDELVGQYVATRESLAGVVIMMDARHPFTPLDRRLIDWLRDAGRPVHVLLTKSDKLSKQSAQQTLAKARRDLQEICPGATVQLFSSLKSEGISEASDVLARLVIAKAKK